MLNLSSNRIDNKIDKKAYASFSETKDYKAARIFARTLIKLLVVFVLLLFLPWTQNIRSRGYVTTLQPDQRPQTINSVIAGKIEI